MTDQAPLEEPRAVVLDEAKKTWLQFTAPSRVLTTHRTGEVLAIVRQVEKAVEQEGVHAAGFISYEASGAFDPCLPVKIDTGFPLVWFGLFTKVREITVEPGGFDAGTALQWEPSVTREEYDACLRAIRRHIYDGDTYQVNFTYRLRARAQVDPWALFVQIAGDGEAPFAAFVDTGEWAICSASPELFLRREGDRLESRPMKGTAPRGLWYEDDLAKREHLIGSEKERAENLMIVDMVRNDLGRMAERGSVQVPALFEAERYPTLWQLTSTVQARTNEPLDRILEAAFPPASITGAPKKRTMEIIEELESTPRRIYTGTIGFVAPGGRAQFNVAIRTVLLHKAAGNAEYGVGGGIVWDSKPESEFEECRTKMKVLTPLPRDFDLLETLSWSPDEGYSLLAYHLRRLARSAEYFGFRMDQGNVMAQLASAAEGLPRGPHRMRLLASRAGGVRCEAAPLDLSARGFNDVVFAQAPVESRDVFLYHKTTRRLVYEDALRTRPGSEDVLLFNESGQITESTVANVAVEIDGVLCTPPVRCGLLPGTQRAELIDHGLLEERAISIQEALQSPNIYLLNSVRGMHKVHIRDGEG